MASETSIFARRSYDGHLCTVRYRGTVDGASGTWIGVEWDDSSRGKHDGSREGKRYFDCLSKKPKAASFIRASKPCDPPRDFLTALGFRYGSANAPNNSAAFDAIFIGGKKVEEVGFQHNSQRLSVWPSLQIISVDGLRVNGICPDSLPAVSRGFAFEFILNSAFACRQLDLSRNLFETWEAVHNISNALQLLRDLNVSSNRFKDLRSEVQTSEDTLKLERLSLANTALDWDTSFAPSGDFLFSNISPLPLTHWDFHTISCPDSQSKRFPGSISRPATLQVFKLSLFSTI
ncbi:MAG: hypothetical protein L6R41_008284 [Letrouitia leprolyta]|nr:MAG: hypothetical protein L6R41_008284 [Letrouitia leprolyta]